MSIPFVRVGPGLCNLGPTVGFAGAKRYLFADGTDLSGIDTVEVYGTTGDPVTLGFSTGSVSIADLDGVPDGDYEYLLVTWTAEQATAFAALDEPRWHATDGDAVPWLAGRVYPTVEGEGGAGDGSATVVAIPGVDAVQTVFVSGVGPAGADGVDGEDGEDGAPGDGSGDVVGPASATAGNLPIFDGTTGKLIADGGVAPSDFASAAQGAAADSAVQPGDAVADLDFDDSSTSLGAANPQAAIEAIVGAMAASLPPNPSGEDDGDVLTVSGGAYVAVPPAVQATARSLVDEIWNDDGDDLTLGGAGQADGTYLIVGRSTPAENGVYVIASDVWSQPDPQPAVVLAPVVYPGDDIGGTAESTAGTTTVAAHNGTDWELVDEIPAGGGGGGLWQVHSETTLGSDTASVELTFPATYQAVRIIAAVQSTHTATVNVYGKVNADVGSNYDQVSPPVNSSFAVWANSTVLKFGNIGSNGASEVLSELEIWHEVRRSGKYAYFRHRNFHDWEYVDRQSLFIGWNRWRNTSTAISTLTLFLQSSKQFEVGSYFRVEYIA